MTQIRVSVLLGGGSGGGGGEGWLPSMMPKCSGDMMAGQKNRRKKKAPTAVTVLSGYRWDTASAT